MPSAGTTKTVAEGQYLESTMNNILSKGGDFPLLASAPNALGYMMATMWWESHCRNVNIIGKRISTSNRYGVGYAYVTDPLMSIYFQNYNALNNYQRTAIDRGLVALSLMQTMGFYHIRNTRLSNELLNTGSSYKSIFEQNGLLVKDGVDPLEIFSNVPIDKAITRTMIAGCVVMESKYRVYIQTSSPEAAMWKSSGAYLGKFGMADANGKTPEQRMEDIRGIINSKPWLTGVEVKQTRVASTDGKQVPPAPLPGCVNKVA